MKIAVVGCGAVGSFYGAKLAQAGHDLHFLLRSDYEHVRRRGVRIRSPKGDFVAHPRTARLPQEIGPSDLVLIALKTTANDALPGLVPPLIQKHSAVLTLQNGLGNEEALAQFVPSEQILGGLCFVCLNRVEPGVIHHLDHGAVVVGEFRRWPEPRTHDIASAFRSGGVPCQVTDDLARAHWEKLVWNIPFNGLGVAAVAGFEAVAEGNRRPETAAGPTMPTDQLLGDQRWFRLVQELMTEVIAIGRALGFRLDDSLRVKNIERTCSMGAYKASTLLDFERGQPLELESLFLRPLAQARKAGVATPRLEALCSVLQELDPL